MLPVCRIFNLNIHIKTKTKTKINLKKVICLLIYSLTYSQPFFILSSKNTSCYDQMIRIVPLRVPSILRLSEHDHAAQASSDDQDNASQFLRYKIMFVDRIDKNEEECSLTFLETINRELALRMDLTNIMRGEELDSEEVLRQLSLAAINHSDHILKIDLSDQASKDLFSFILDSSHTVTNSHMLLLMNILKHYSLKHDALLNNAALESFCIGMNMLKLSEFDTKKLEHPVSVDDSLGSDSDPLHAESVTAKPVTAASVQSIQHKMPIMSDNNLLKLYGGANYIKDCMAKLNQQESAGPSTPLVPLVAPDIKITPLSLSDIVRPVSSFSALTPPTASRRVDPRNLASQVPLQTPSDDRSSLSSEVKSDSKYIDPMKQLHILQHLIDVFYQNSKKPHLIASVSRKKLLEILEKMKMVSKTKFHLHDELFKKLNAYSNVLPFNVWKCKKIGSEMLIYLRIENANGVLHYKNTLGMDCCFQGDWERTDETFDATYASGVISDEVFDLSNTAESASAANVCADFEHRNEFLLSNPVKLLCKDRKKAGLLLCKSSLTLCSELSAKNILLKPSLIPCIMNQKHRTINLDDVMKFILQALT